MKKKIIEIKSTVIGIVTGIILGIALVLTGCGDSSASEDNIRNVESIDENGNVIASEDEGDTISEADASSEAEPAADDADASEDTDSSEDTDVSDDTIRVVENGKKDYLQYMSEEELRALAVEALDAAGYDTTLADGRLRTKSLLWELPEGFEENPKVKDVYITGRYPIDATNIRYFETDVDYTLQLMDQNTFEEMLEASYEEQYSEPVDVKITEYNRIKINRVPTFRIQTEFDLDEYHMYQLIYIVNASKTYTIVYTGTSEFDRMEWFEESASSLKVAR